MKMTVTVLIMLILPMALFAEDSTDNLNSEELFSMSPNLQGKTLDEIRFDDLVILAEELSIRKQEEMYVKRMAKSSFLIPGTGQLKTGQTGLGIAQLSMHLAIVGGTALGTYNLLPQELKDSLDNYGETKAYFETLDYAELLPASGVFWGGLFVNWLLAHWSAEGAAQAARANIEEGSVQFSPDLRLIDGMPFVGASFHY